MRDRHNWQHEFIFCQNAFHQNTGQQIFSRIERQFLPGRRVRSTCVISEAGWGSGSRWFSTTSVPQPGGAVVADDRIGLCSQLFDQRIEHDPIFKPLILAALGWLHVQLAQ